MAASLAMAGTPAFAAELPLPRHAAINSYDAAAGNADHYRRHRGRDRGMDAGDVIAGILVLGAVAAIVSTASRDRDERPRRYPADRRLPDDRYDSSGLSRAVDMCVAEIERGRDRVASVDDAARDASGWRVSGELASGDSFTCRIGNDGRISEVDIGAGSRSAYDSVAYPSTENRQYSDDVYARLRAGQSSAEADYGAPVDGDLYGDELRPAYPGGPLPGEEGYDDYVEDGRFDSVRYQPAR